LRVPTSNERKRIREKGKGREGGKTEGKGQRKEGKEKGKGRGRRKERGKSNPLFSPPSEQKFWLRAW